MMEIDIPSLDDVVFTEGCPRCPRWGDSNPACPACHGLGHTLNGVGIRLVRLLKDLGIRMDPNRRIGRDEDE